MQKSKPQLRKLCREQKIYINGLSSKADYIKALTSVQSPTSQTQLMDQLYAKEGNVTVAKSDSEEDSGGDELFTTPLAGAVQSPGDVLFDPNNIELAHMLSDEDLYKNNHNIQHSPIAAVNPLDALDLPVEKDGDIGSQVQIKMYNDENEKEKDSNKMRKSLVILLFLVLLYTFGGVTYLLFWAQPNCDCNATGANALLTNQETYVPTVNPTEYPTTSSPSFMPSSIPTSMPSNSPSTESPTIEPTMDPTLEPTLEPTTSAPTIMPPTYVLSIS